MSEPTVCLWSVDGSDCGQVPVVGRVTMKNGAGSARVPVCAEHKAEHDRRAAKQRVKH